MNTVVSTLPCTTGAQRRTRLNRRRPTAPAPEEVVEASESLQPRTSTMTCSRYLPSRMARARFAAGRSQQRWSQACTRGHFLISIASAR